MARIHSTKARRKVSLKNAGRKPGESSGNSDFTWWVRSRLSELHAPPTLEQVIDFRIWTWERIAACESDMLDYNKPIRVFYANLLYAGVTCKVKDGKLIVAGKTGQLSPAYREEIIKRKAQLMELLAVEPPEELEEYFGRLLKLTELKSALWTAERIKARVKATPCNGGWLLEMETQK